MNGITLLLRALRHGEHDLERELLAVADRHRADHEVHHVATDLARWSHEHAERLSDTARSRGLRLPGPADDPSPSLLARLHTRVPHGTAHSREPGLLLLDDLRGLHLAACDNSLRWEMLAQAARATADLDLLGLATACHPRTLRQMRWTSTMIKTLAAQTLTSP